MENDIHETMWNSDFYPEVEVYPMNRFIPSIGSKLTKKKWSEITSQLMKAEFTSVAERLRKAGTFHINSGKLKAQLQQLSDNNLFFEPILACRPVSGFAHRFYEPIAGESMDVFGSISHNRNYAKLLKRAFLKENHKVVGKLLGYPECCIDFFNKTWGATPRIIDPVWQYGLNGEHKVIDKNTIEIVSANPRTNLLPRYFNYRFTPHITCKPDCKETIEQSHMYEQLIPKKAFSEAMNLIDRDMEWNNYKGLVELRADGFIGIANSTPYKEKKVIRWVS